MADCLFCRIVRGEIPAQRVFESPGILAFRDLKPLAPVHVLIIPKVHVDSVNALHGRSDLAAALLDAAVTIAQQQGIAESGYRLIANTNHDAGQEVFHVHLHLLGGRALGKMLGDL